VTVMVQEHNLSVRTSVLRLDWRGRHITRRACARMMRRSLPRLKPTSLRTIGMALTNSIRCCAARVSESAGCTASIGRYG